tara:strand:- start:458 stop:850 length:393 start_codon:yes stop_codon:yes gene_type:complete
MAIKVSGTPVIDNSRNFINIEDTTGFYRIFHPDYTSQASSGSITINANVPCLGLTLSGALTISDMTNKATGKQVVLLTDVSSSGYDITWGSNFEFVNDAEPDWTTARYWTIGLTVWNSSVILVTATSYSG